MTAEGSGPAATGIGLMDGYRRLQISVRALWLGYFSVGGNGSLADVRDWLSDRGTVPALDHDMLAQALNDRFTEVGLDHPVAYTRA